MEDSKIYSANHRMLPILKGMGDTRTKYYSPLAGLFLNEK